MYINRRLKHSHGALSKSKNSFCILCTAGRSQCKWYKWLKFNYSLHHKYYIQYIQRYRFHLLSVISKKLGWAQPEETSSERIDNPPVTYLGICKKSKDIASYLARHGRYIIARCLVEKKDYCLDRISQF